MPAKNTQATAAIHIYIYIYKNKHKASGRLIVQQFATPAHFSGYGASISYSQQTAPGTRHRSHLDPKAEHPLLKAPLSGQVGKSEPLVPCGKGNGFLPAAGVQRVGAHVPRDGNPPVVLRDGNAPEVPRVGNPLAAPRPSTQPPMARSGAAAHTEPWPPAPTTISFQSPFYQDLPFLSCRG